MSTTDNNKMIAEFMGYTQPHPEYPSTTYWYKKGKAPLTMLSFDTDWNWLMEVVKKIENFGFEFFIVESRCKIAHNTDRFIETIIDFEITGTKIQATHKAVVEFIKYYNDESKAS